LLQEKLSCLDENYRTLETQIDILKKGSSNSSEAILLSNASTSNGCSRCSNLEINACTTNIESLQALQKENERLNALVKYGCIKTYKSKDALYKTIQAKDNKQKRGLGFDQYTSKPNGRVLLNGVECLKFVKGGKQVDHPTQTRQPKAHAPQCSFYASYMLKRDHRGKVVALYVGPRTRDRIVKRNVWVPKVLVTNAKGPKQIWVPKIKA
jgi:hypothetical protein